MKLRRPRSASRGTAPATARTARFGVENFSSSRTESVERVAHLRPFRLPGGDKAVKEPRRTALGLLYEMYRRRRFSNGTHLPPLQDLCVEWNWRALKTNARDANSIRRITSSMGRLFDAVASLVDLRQQMRFEGQAAMELEFALDGIEHGRSL